MKKFYFLFAAVMLMLSVASCGHKATEVIEEGDVIVTEDTITTAGETQTEVDSLNETPKTPSTEVQN